MPDAVTSAPGGAYKGVRACDVGLVALEKIGPDALDDVLEVAAELGPEGCLEEVMHRWEVKDERVYQAFMRLADVRPPLAASFLGQYGDPRAMPLMQRLLDEFELTDNIFRNRDVLEYEYAIHMLGGELTTDQQQKIDAFREMSAAWRRQITSTDSRVPEKRPGRNEPCWCGSGKKYKKCHLESDRQG